MSLWTKRLDGEHIVTREASDTYQCHICNINVPKICYQKHNGSDQHETFMKVYQKVLERASKQTYVNSVNSNEDIDKDSYYCEPCSKIIKLVNKSNHEASEYHAKSVKDSIIITEFYKIMNENIRFDVNEELLGEESDAFNCDFNEMNMDDWMSIDSDDDLFDENSILPPVPALSIIKTNNQSAKDDKKQSFEEYLKEIIKKYNLKVTLPVVDGEFITIVAPNGDKVKVSRDHFQGYKKRDGTYCQLCRQWIPKNTRDHDVSSEHVLNIFRPINDKFARWIDEDLSHCLPCNVLVPTHSNLHTLDYVHNKIIKDTHLLQTGKTLCEDCNMYVDTNNFAVHVLSKKHLNVLMKQNYIQKTGSNNIFCKICNVTIPSSELKFHISTELHLEKKTNEKNEKIDAYYDMTEFVDETRTKVRCKICGVIINFVEQSIIKHMEGRNHIEKVNKQKLEAYNELLFYADNEKTKLKCQICDVYIPDVDRHIIDHMEGRNHEFAENELLKFHSISRESSEFFCECCSIRTTDYIEHMFSRNHTLQFAEKYQIDRTEMRKYVYEDNVNNFVAQRHRVRYINLLKHNGIFKVDDANYYCGICQIKLSKFNEIDHVLGERHRSIIKLSPHLQQIQLTDVIVIT